MTPDEVRALPCCCCGAPPRSHAHHPTGRGKGLGTKNADDDTIPLCVKCHTDLHAHSGFFRSMSREQHQLWQELQVDRVHRRGFLPSEPFVECFACNAAARDTGSIVHGLRCPVMLRERGVQA